MSHRIALTLRVRVPGAASYPIGDEIWNVGLAEAIAEEADTIAGQAGAELLKQPNDNCRAALRARVIEEMTEALIAPGDTYAAPDGVHYSLVAQPEPRIL
jgi:hypothetical protein